MRTFGVYRFLGSYLPGCPEPTVWKRQFVKCYDTNYNQTILMCSAMYLICLKKHSEPTIWWYTVHALLHILIRTFIRSFWFYELYDIVLHSSLPGFVLRVIDVWYLTDARFHVTLFLCLEVTIYYCLDTEKATLTKVFNADSDGKRSNTTQRSPRVSCQFKLVLNSWKWLQQ